MPKKTKKQLNAEFLEKIQSINIGGSSKPKSDEVNCPDCGEPMLEFKAHMIPIAVGIAHVPKGMFGAREQKPKHNDSNEAAFAA